MNIIFKISITALIFISTLSDNAEAQEINKFDSLFKNIEQHINQSDNIILLKKFQVKGNKIKINQKYQHKSHILLRDSTMYRFYLSTFYKSIQSPTILLKKKNSEILLSLKGNEKSEHFIYKDIQFDSSGKYYIEVHSISNSGFGIFALSLIVNNQKQKNELYIDN